MRIMVVEDEEMILEGLLFSLRQEGYEVCSATSKEAAVRLYRDLVSERKNLNLCILDVMLPDGTGFDICREIRMTSEIPILFLTACDDEINTVRALEMGADDYVTKPFRLRELLARVKALLRRSGSDTGVAKAKVHMGANEIDLNSAKVYRDGAEIVLTAMEYKLLLIFVAHKGQILEREQILNTLWDDVGEFVNDNTLTVYIKRLRSKLGDDDGNHPIIQTIRGIGYLWE